MRYPIILLFVLCLVLSPMTKAKDAFLWRSGENLYIKLTQQDFDTAPPNQHPITLDRNDIANALNTLQIWTKDYLSSEQPGRPIFTAQQTQLLARYLTEGLEKATPKQDITFAIASQKKGTLGSLATRFVAGRIFYLNDQLNLIIGDYDRPVDKGLEAMYSSTGTQKVRYFLKAGHRKRASRFKQKIIAEPGINYHLQQGKKRLDWLMLDIEHIKATQLAQKANSTTKISATSSQFSDDARERRELRAEMARMRQEMEQQKQNASTSSIEERLKHLEGLKKQDLITDKEYAKKREQILSEI